MFGVVHWPASSSDFVKNIIFEVWAYLDKYYDFDIVCIDIDCKKIVYEKKVLLIKKHGCFLGYRLCPIITNIS